MKSFKEHTECPTWKDHDWETSQHSQTKTQHIMRCTKCGQQMSLSRIEQQNKMLSQKRLVNTIRKRKD